MAPPGLCFGDSLTEGYHGVWAHPHYGPRDPPNPDTDDVQHVKFRPYSVRLGGRLAALDGVAEGEIHVGVSLRYAQTRAYSGWTAAELLPPLEAALRAETWRTVVVLAGSNDIVLEGVSAKEAFVRVRRLHQACHAAGVPLVVVAIPDCETMYHSCVPEGEKEASREALRQLHDLLVANPPPCGTLLDARLVLPLDTEHAELWDDCIHMSPKGSDRFADSVFDALRTLPAFAQ